MENVSVDDEDEHHDQLPSIEDVKIAPEDETIIPSSPPRGNHRRLMGFVLCLVIVALSITVAVTKSVGATARRFQKHQDKYVPFDAEQIQFVISIAAKQHHLSLENPSMQWQALQEVKKHPEMTTSNEVMQLYALWCLQLATNLVPTDVANEQYTTLPSWSHSWMDSGDDWCLWHGVRCDRNNEVVELQLGNNDLTGALPKEMKLLSKLATLNVTSNKGLGQGGVPAWLATIPSLKQADVRGCSYVHGANALCETLSSSIDRDVDLTVSADCPEKIPCACCQCDDD